MSGPRGVFAILVAAALAAAAYLYWPVAPGVHMKVTVSNESPTATPSLTVLGPSVRATIGVVPAGESRSVVLSDPGYGVISLSSDSTPAVLGLFDLEGDEGVDGANGSLDVRWTGARAGYDNYGFVDLGIMRYRGMGPSVIGGVWPLRADDGTVDEP